MLLDCVVGLLYHFELIHCVSRAQYAYAYSTEVSGVENIGQCGRLSQLSWLLGAL